MKRSLRLQPYRRSLGLVFIGIGWIAVSLPLWHARHGGTATRPIPGHAIYPSAGPISIPVIADQSLAQPVGSGPPAAGPATLSGEAAVVALRKNGRYESLGKALTAARHAVEKIDPAGPDSRGAEYYANNPDQRLRAWFFRDGVELASGQRAANDQAVPWSLSLRLRGVGREGDVGTIPSGNLTAEGMRLEMNYPVAAVTQWFENRKEGVEQGFILQQPPVGKAGEVTLLLGVDGDLHPEAMDGRESVRFVDTTGAEILHYSGIKAWDATGHPLQARMEVRGSALLALVVADSGVRYPVTIDPLFANVEARLTEESVAGDNFGSSVAVAGDTALVGAPYETTAAGTRTGCAYLFVRTGDVWSRQARITSADGASSDRFGWSVALSGDSALIGAPYHETVSGKGAGCAYVFVRNGTDWIQQIELTAADGASSDGFGWAVALSGETALVGAIRGDSAAGADTGSVYAFLRIGEVWEQQQKITASDGVPNDLFGNSLAIEGDVALIGASGADMVAATNAGSAYVFVRTGMNWTQQAKLTATDAASDDQFGNSVALSGNTALIGASAADTSAGTNAGSAYVYVRDGASWNQQAKLTASDAAVNDWFGCSVSLAADTALIGAYHDDTAAGSDTGSAYVFSRSGTIWTQQAKLIAANAATNDCFGGAVALSGDTALVGASLADIVAGTDAGNAYVFVRHGTAWIQQTDLTPSDAGAYDSFASSVTLAGVTALVGVPNDDTAAGVNAGSAYVFVLTGSLWHNQAKLNASNAAANDRFGVAVAMSGDTALIGAEGSDTPTLTNAGSAYVFVRNGINWSQQLQLTADDAADNDSFGSSVALAGETALVGAPHGRTESLPDTGSAYVFVRNGTSWSQQAKLTWSPAGSGDWFGWSVALSNDTALVGAPFANTAAGWAAGRAFAFVRGGGVWQQQAVLTASDAAANDWFGWSVALADDHALIGSPYGHRETGMNTGSAYVFLRGGITWNQQAKLTASDAANGDNFGSSVALAGSTALVGAPGDDMTAGLNAGSVYAFKLSGAVWNQQVKLTAGLDASSYDNFGGSVGFAGDTVLVGAPNDDTAGYHSGSAYAFLLGELPAITRQPVSGTVMPGKAVTFSVTATGYMPLGYPWRKNGYLIDGASSTSYTIPSSQVTDQGNYDCVVSNIGGVATSAAAMLTINALSQLTQAPPSLPPAAHGYVFVTLTPPGIAAGWRFVGEQQWRASDVPASGLATGDRTIEFRPVAGYMQPPQENVGVVSGEAATVIERSYYQTSFTGSGGLTVILKPETIAAATVPAEIRAQWRIQGEDDTHWRDSGTTLTGLLAGSYLIECKPVAGRTTPPASTVPVVDGQSATPTITYFLADAQSGSPPSPVPFDTVNTNQNMPYAYMGQIRSDIGLSSGFVVKRRVVATAGHVVFNDATLSAVTGLQWLFQRAGESYEPEPQIPRGFYTFDGYAAQRAADNSPGSSSPQSQNLDAAALYFGDDAGRGGFGGFLASDLDSNEFLISDAQKMLVGYPVDGIAMSSQGQMFATPPADVTFAKAFGHTYTTAAIRSSGGGSGGPLCVLYQGGPWYPAAIYLGGSNETVVRSIDSQVIDLFNRAEVSSNGGDNNTGGGITHTSVTGNLNTTLAGSLTVFIQPAAAITAGAGWRLKSETSYRPSGTQKSGLSQGGYNLEFPTIAGFQVPIQASVTVTGGQSNTYTLTYAYTAPPPVITSANWAAGTRGQTLSYQIAASNSPDSYSLAGTLPVGLSLNAATWLISGTPQEAGVFIVTLGATNNGGTGTKNLTIICRPSLADQSVSVPLGGTLHYQIASSEGGAGVYYTATNLSQGVDMNPDTGLIMGCPPQPGAFPSLISVSKDGASASAILTITVTTSPLDAWRMTHFGTYSNAGTAADTADPDHDGQNNLAEYASGTDPNNAADVLKVLSTQRSGTTFTLTANGKAGRTYALQRCTNLVTGSWITVTTTGPLGADATLPLTDTAAPAGKAFYRIQVSAP